MVVVDVRRKKIEMLVLMEFGVGNGGEGRNWRRRWPSGLPPAMGSRQRWRMGLVMEASTKPWKRRDRERDKSEKERGIK